MYKFYINPTWHNYHNMRRVFKSRYWWQIVETPNADKHHCSMSNSSKDLDRLRGKLVVPDQPTFKPPKNEPVRIVNKIHNNQHLVKKAVLFENLMNYYKMTGENADANIPVTFTIKEGVKDPEFDLFKHYFNKNIEQKT